MSPVGEVVSYIGSDSDIMLDLIERFPSPVGEVVSYINDICVSKIRYASFRPLSGK